MRSPATIWMPAYSAMPPSLISLTRPGTRTEALPFVTVTDTGKSTGCGIQRRGMGKGDIAPPKKGALILIPQTETRKVTKVLDRLVTGDGCRHSCPVLRFAGYRESAGVPVSRRRLPLGTSLSVVGPPGFEPGTNRL